MRIFAILLLLLQIDHSHGREIIGVEISSESGIYQGGFVCYLSSKGDYGYQNIVYRPDGEQVELRYLMEDHTGMTWHLMHKKFDFEKIRVRLAQKDFGKETAPPGSMVSGLRIIFSDGSSEKYKSFTNRDILNVCRYLEAEGWIKAKRYIPVISPYIEKNIGHMETLKYPTIYRGTKSVESSQKKLQ